MSAFSSHRAVAHINTAALAENYKILTNTVKRGRNRSPTLIATVKANAYGHGLSLAVPALLTAGCRYFAVATVEEGVAVRSLAPKAKILILGYTPPHEAATLFFARLYQTVFSLEYGKALSRAAASFPVPLPVHLKVDGGMCRLGVSPLQTAELLKTATLPHLSPIGMFTHFPSADTNQTATKEALCRFYQCKEVLNSAGIFPFCHAAASAAALTLPQSRLDGVRLGLSLYGISPVPTDLPLIPVMRLTAPIVQIHTVKKGTPVGYGGDYVTKKDARIATCPIGYADGVRRAFRGQTVAVFHQNCRFSCPVAGRICMDYLMLDVTDTPAAVGDTVELFENATTMAEAVGTVPYEILSTIGPRVVRQAEP